MTTQTPMTISVLPMCDQTIVTASQVAVRPACNERLIELSPCEPAERTLDELADADDHQPEHDRGQHGADDDVAQGAPDGGRLSSST